ncbi:MAG TPA: MerR family DNA-binding transcriptional regulator [Candidatus Stackebrandtia excrementipullorum]|nr:MerR family DNA-binding transcriptional regulator [Candidatus Stackebrandtia excrementipullorum]
MRIGEVAAATDVSHRSLRHYERAGLLRVERGPNGCRSHPKSIVNRVLNICWTPGRLSTTFGVSSPASTGTSPAQTRPNPSCGAAREGRDRPTHRRPAACSKPVGRGFVQNG